jgi:hypothetical protein
MWRHYFSPASTYVGVDNNVLTRPLFRCPPAVEIEIGSQDNATFWREFKTRHAPFDLIVDDGGHTMDQQRTTFEEMWGHLAGGGVYIVEDVHTSYKKDFGGGFGLQSTWVEESKRLVDHLNGERAAKGGAAGYVWGVR